MIRANDTIMLSKEEFNILAQRAVKEFSNDLELPKGSLLDIVNKTAFLAGIAMMGSYLFEEDENDNT